MTIDVKMFGIAKEIFGQSSVDIDSPGIDTCNVGELKNKLERRQPRLKELGSYMIAVNNEYATDELMLEEKDEVAVIPPVSGG